MDTTEIDEALRAVEESVGEIDSDASNASDYIRAVETNATATQRSLRTLKGEITNLLESLDEQVHLKLDKIVNHIQDMVVNGSIYSVNRRNKLPPDNLCYLKASVYTDECLFRRAPGNTEIRDLVNNPHVWRNLVEDLSEYEDYRLVSVPDVFDVLNEEVVPNPAAHSAPPDVIVTEDTKAKLAMANDDTLIYTAKASDGSVWFINRTASNQYRKLLVTKTQDPFLATTWLLTPLQDFTHFNAYENSDKTKLVSSILPVMYDAGVAIEATYGNTTYFLKIYPAIDGECEHIRCFPSMEDNDILEWVRPRIAIYEFNTLAFTDKIVPPFPVVITPVAPQGVTVTLQQPDSVVKIRAGDFISTSLHNLTVRAYCGQAADGMRIFTLGLCRDTGFWDIIHNGTSVSRELWESLNALLLTVQERFSLDEELLTVLKTRLSCLAVLDENHPTPMGSRSPSIVTIPETATEYCKSLEMVVGRLYVGTFADKEYFLQMTKDLVTNTFDYERQRRYFDNDRPLEDLWEYVAQPISDYKDVIPHSVLTASEPNQVYFDHSQQLSSWDIAIDCDTFTGEGTHLDMTILRFNKDYRIIVHLTDFSPNHGSKKYRVTPDYIKSGVCGERAKRALLIFNQKVLIRFHADNLTKSLWQDFYSKLKLQKS